MRRAACGVRRVRVGGCDVECFALNINRFIYFFIPYFEVP